MSSGHGWPASGGQGTSRAAEHTMASLVLQNRTLAETRAACSNVDAMLTATTMRPPHTAEHEDHSDHSPITQSLLHGKRLHLAKSCAGDAGGRRAGLRQMLNHGRARRAIVLRLHFDRALASACSSIALGLQSGTASQRQRRRVGTNRTRAEITPVALYHHGPGAHNNDAQRCAPSRSRWGTRGRCRCAPESV
jgi:hypothetical protein